MNCIQVHEHRIQVPISLPNQQYCWRRGVTLLIPFHCIPTSTISQFYSLALLINHIVLYGISASFHRHLSFQGNFWGNVARPCNNYIGCSGFAQACSHSAQVYSPSAKVGAVISRPQTKTKPAKGRINPESCGIQREFDDGSSVAAYFHHSASLTNATQYP